MFLQYNKHLVHHSFVHVVHAMVVFTNDHHHSRYAIHSDAIQHPIVNIGCHAWAINHRIICGRGYNY